VANAFGSRIESRQPTFVPHDEANVDLCTGAPSAGRVVGSVWYAESMADPANKRGATYQDVLDAPEHLVAEIIGGELRLSPRPGGPASSVATKLTGELVPPFNNGRGGPGGWIIVLEPELHLGDEIVVPDLAGWRTERLPAVPEGAFFTLPPDWICEVVSPRSETTDRLEKMPLYASVGVGHAWLVHPRRRSIEAFRLHEGKWLAIAIHRSNERAGIEPFDAIEIDLAVLWADLPLPTKASEEASEYSAY
jgi:Uma2 family endonuclease